jgi:multiple sugar transport system substrate-binding protein/raffinose/stachyose/melibiose transport system substrate-binding protein
MDFWQGLADEYHSLCPNVTIKTIAAQGQLSADLRTMLSAGNPPDVAHNIQPADFVKADALAPFVVDDAVKQIDGWEKQLIKGQLYNLSSEGLINSTVFYNKSLFAKAGITSPPTTIPDFEADLAKLKAAGITPIITGNSNVIAGQGQWVALPQVYGQDPCWGVKRSQKQASFTDPMILAGLTRIHNWFTNGYFEPGALSVDYGTAEQMFLQGKGAMWIMGAWYTGSDAQNPSKGFETGVFATPSDDGKVHLLTDHGTSGMVVLKASQHQPEAVAFSRWLMLDRPTNTKLLTALGVFSILKPPAPMALTPLQQQVIDMANNAATAENYLFLSTGDCVAPPGQFDPWIPAMESLLTPQGDPLAAAQSLDKAWDLAVASQ